MAVVRAGDTQSLLGTHDSQNPPSSRDTLPGESGKLSRSPNNGETPVESAGDRITPLQIPPPPALPNDLIEKSGSESRLTETETVAEVPGSLETKVPSPAPETDIAPPGPASPSRVAVNSKADIATSDFASSGSVTPPQLASKRPKYGTAAVVLASLGLLAVILTALSGRNAEVFPSHSMKSGAAITQAPIDSTPSAYVVPKTPGENTTIGAGPVPAPTHEAPAAASAVPETTRVTLELMPIDAKVSLHGHEISGPPFEFDVPKGEKLAVEVKRAGFGTAKVVIDGKKPLVHFGMLHEAPRHAP